MRLLEVLDLGAVLGGVRELKGNALAMSASRKVPALNYGHFVRHLGMDWITRNREDPGLRYSLARPATLGSPNEWQQGGIADLRRPCGERLGLAESGPLDRNERVLSTVVNKAEPRGQDRTTPGRFKLGR
jgi:hypothetical protein